MPWAERSSVRGVSVTVDVDPTSLSTDGCKRQATIQPAGPSSSVALFSLSLVTAGMTGGKANAMDNDVYELMTGSMRYSYSVRTRSLGIHIYIYRYLVI